MAKMNVCLICYNELILQSKSPLNEVLRSELKFKTFKAKMEELGLTEAAKTARKVKGGYFDKLCPLSVLTVKLCSKWMIT